MDPAQDATEEGGGEGLRRHTWGVCSVRVLFVLRVSVLWCVFSVCVCVRCSPRDSRAANPQPRVPAGGRVGTGPEGTRYFPTPGT